MRLREMSIYQVASYFMNIDELFEKDDFLKDFYKESNKSITKEVLNPELSENGLRYRKDNIMAVVGFLAIYGFVVFLISAFSRILFPEADIIVFLYIVPYSMIGAAMHIALFRAQRAFLDEKRFKREGKPKDFKINTKAHIRWYDLLMGIPLGIVVVTDLIGRVPVY